MFESMTARQCTLTKIILQLLLWYSDWEGQRCESLQKETLLVTKNRVEHLWFEIKLMKTNFNPALQSCNLLITHLTSIQTAPHLVQLPLESLGKRRF